MYECINLSGQFFPPSFLSHLVGVLCFCGTAREKGSFLSPAYEGLLNCKQCSSHVEVLILIAGGGVKKINTEAICHAVSQTLAWGVIPLTTKMGN